MIKSIFFKEWIKTRRCYAVVCLAMFGFVGYCMLNVNRVAEIKGAPHLWEVMILKDAVFLDIFKYVPTFLGILFGLMQFVPEMQNRCLKLTLHLPYSNHRMLAVMQLFGLTLLAACFALSVLMIVLVYARIFVSEMVAAAVLTALPWFMAGLEAYLLTAFVCLESTWRLRLAYLAMSLLMLRIFLFDVSAQAYVYALPWLAICIAMTFMLPYVSVARFKDGCQD